MSTSWRSQFGGQILRSILKKLKSKLSNETNITILDIYGRFIFIPNAHLSTELHFTEATCILYQKILHFRPYQSKIEITSLSNDQSTYNAVKSDNYILLQTYIGYYL